MQNLSEHIAAKRINAVRHPNFPLTLYSYTDRCVYERAWDDTTLACRGLVLNDQGDIVARPFPKFFNDTEPEAQPIPWGERCEITEKLDGTSFTAWFRDGEVGIASRNWEVKTDVPGWYSTAFHDNSLDGKLRAMGRNIAIQGEIIGPSIQGNKYKLDALKMFVFDIYDIDMKRYVSASERTELCTRLGLTHVPVIPYTLLNLQENPTVDDVLKAADGNSSLAMTPREGLVFKGDARFKAISNLWLLANE